MGADEQTRDGFEVEETALVRDVLGTAEVFVDIGANVGFYTCLACIAGVQVVAVEPLPTNLEFLFRNLDANGCQDVTVLPVALADRTGITRMFGETTGASLVQGWGGNASRKSTWVPLVRADDVLQAFVQGRRTLIKIDVEGAECELLDGARQLLLSRPSPLWLIEVGFREHHPGGQHPRFREVFETFWRAGYVVESLPERRAVEPPDIERWIASGIRDFGSYNYFAAPEGARKDGYWGDTRA